MFTKTQIIAHLVITVLYVPRFASAQIKNPIQYETLSELLGAIIDILIIIAVPIVVIAIIYIGFTFVTAGGNAEKVTSAKSALLWTVIGAMILLGARVVSSVVQETVKGIEGG